MKSVLFVMPNLGGGGAEKVLIDILKKINKKKFNITLVLFKKEGNYANDIPKEIKVIEIANSFPILPGRIWIKILKKYPKSFYKFIIKENYDVEIAFMEGVSTKFVANSFNENSKKIAWVHIDMLKKHWTDSMYYKDEEKICYDKYNDIVFVSKDAAKSFDKLFKKEYKNKRIIYNPIIDDEITEKAERNLIEYKDFTIISSGRLDKQKGYDRLIKAHSKLVKNFPHNLVILGEGIERENLEKIIRDLGVESSVELKGFMKNPYPYIKAADLYVCSSRTEGYPLVVAETVILEKAILATNITGPKEILDNGLYGKICDDSEYGIYEGIREFLIDKNLVKIYEEKSKIGRSTLNYKKVIRNIEDLIES